MLTIYRCAHWLARHRVPLLPRLLYILNRILFAVVLPPTVEVGPGTVFGYSGLGIVVHARCRLGARVNVGANVTIGGRSGLYEVPVLEDEVEVGAGARILGPVRIGRGAKIGANAVVLHDVPAGATVVGIPARIVGAAASPSSSRLPQE